MARRQLRLRHVAADAVAGDAAVVVDVAAVEAYSPASTACG
jgi:hypothetical protein